MKIRQFAREDLTTILAIQKSTPLAAQWSENDYLTLAGHPRGLMLVAEMETMQPPNVLGFAAFYRMLDEAELCNLAVHPEHQRRGIGRALLAEAQKRLTEAGVKHLYLEVRASNIPALKLYYSLGYSLLNLRKDYYRHPTEDACVLRCQLYRHEA